jgi:hypothetical protein
MKRERIEPPTRKSEKNSFCTTPQRVLKQSHYANPDEIDLAERRRGVGTYTLSGTPPVQALEGRSKVVLTKEIGI